MRPSAVIANATQVGRLPRALMRPRQIASKASNPANNFPGLPGRLTRHRSVGIWTEEHFMLQFVRSKAKIATSPDITPTRLAGFV